MAESEEIHVKLREYKQLLDDGVINKDEFDDLKKSVLDNLNTP
ncbi:SHOCT domain-containing protein, partial [Leuconostoc mesenteroides]